MNDLDAYQRKARTGAVYGGLDDLPALGLGLCEEAGEVARELLAGLRADGPPDRARLIEEAGDVLASLALLTYACGLTLSEVAAASLAKLEIRRRERPGPE